MTSPVRRVAPLLAAAALAVVWARRRGTLDLWFDGGDRQLSLGTLVLADRGLLIEAERLLEELA